MRVADCQGFAGGFTLGAVQAGLDLVVKVENVGGFGMAQCEANRGLLGQAWLPYVGPADEWADVGRSEGIAGSEVVISNPPCSGFSVMSNPGFRGVDSRINSCMWDAVRFAAAVRPEVYVMESVRSAFTKGLPLMRQLRSELERLTGDEYTLTHVIQDNYALGGCAKRQRYFMVCSRVPFGVEVPELVAQPTVADAIGDLADQPLSWEYQPYHAPATWWSAPARSSGLGTDGHALPPGAESNHILDLLDPDPDVWRQGWAESEAAREYLAVHGDFPPSWHVKTRKTVATGQVRTLAKRATETDFDFGMFQAKRWRWGAPAFVITGAGPFIGLHPTRPRYFTHREIARMMGFPDDWLIEPLRQEKTLTAGWGKGVSVHPGRWVSHWAKESIEGRPGTEQHGRTIDSWSREIAPEPREFIIDVSKHWKTVGPSETMTVATVWKNGRVPAVEEGAA